jgi:phosphomannomutase
MHRVTVDLSKIFKAYDIRGVYPTELNEDAASRIGVAFARFTGADRIAVGRDMRMSSPPLTKAFVDGLRRGGASVVDFGLVSTDALYFGSGVLDVPGAMFTASHNPAEYNGLKLCLKGAAPIASDTGLEEIRRLAQEASVAGPPVGALEHRNILGDYATHCRSFVDIGALRPIKVAVDAGNGMAGKTVPPVLEPLPFSVVPLYFELDGTFPNHPANPIEPENLVDLQRVVS